MRYIWIFLIVIGLTGAAVAPPVEAANPFCKNGKLKKDKCK